MARSKASAPDRRSGRTQSLAQTLRRLTQGPFAKRGFARHEIVTRWPDIVGPVLARQTCPEKITRSHSDTAGGTLHIRAESGFALELQHLEPQMIDRINGYFGFRAVDRIAIVQGPVPTRPPRRAPRLHTLTDDETRRIDGAATGTADPALGEALRRLGNALFRRHGPS
ncbi:MAG TPA: DciA family protein [Alphaproteobacteria bacterium]|jgi:hypothetical protein|nr:DciA family protein [Alphaproteobacteria bacterium]